VFSTVNDVSLQFSSTLLSIQDRVFAGQHVTRTPLSRSKGQRSTCRGGGISLQPPAQLVHVAVKGNI